MTCSCHLARSRHSWGTLAFYIQTTKRKAPILHRAQREPGYLWVRFADRGDGATKRLVKTGKRGLLASRHPAWRDRISGQRQIRDAAFVRLDATTCCGESMPPLQQVALEARCQYEQCSRTLICTSEPQSDAAMGSVDARRGSAKSVMASN